MNEKLITQILFTCCNSLIVLILLGIFLYVTWPWRKKEKVEKKTCWRIIDTHGKEFYVYADYVNSQGSGIYLFNQDSDGGKKDHIAHFPEGSSYCKLV